MRCISIIAVTATMLLQLVDIPSLAAEYAPNQPYSSYWFVDELLAWEPVNDPHVPFNISSIPLANRFTHAPTQRNPRLSTKPQIMTLVSAHPTSNYPSQSFRESSQYVFPYWQYIDAFVMWGGAANEGIILSPNAQWINAGHRNGVKVYGTVFFPPKEYGGKTSWVRQFLQKSPQGEFPVADKLIEVARLYGFDGWFINQETPGLRVEHALAMQEFLAYYQQRAARRLEMIWYDSMIDSGKIDWQEQLNDRNVMYFQDGTSKRSDLMFLDFGWKAAELVNTAKRAKSVGRSPWELFAGIDVQSRSYGTPVRWDALYRDGGPAHTSIALYWPSSTRDIAREKTLAGIYQCERKFWNGCDLERPFRGIKQWEGFADYFPARSTIQSLPFVTQFNYGAGDFYCEMGHRVSESSWYNISIQDLLPTWQWNTDLSKLNPTFDFSDAYEGGSSLRIDVTLDENETAYLPLYKVNLPVSTSTVARLALKVPDDTTSLSLALTFVGRESELEEIPLKLETAGEWESIACKLDDFVDEKLAAIGLTFEARDHVRDRSLFLGELAVLDPDSSQPEPPRVEAQPFFSGDLAEVNLRITDNQSQAGWSYNIYEIQSDGSRRWLGKTVSKNYYIAEIRRPQNRESTTIAVTASNRQRQVSLPTTLDIRW